METRVRTSSASGANTVQRGPRRFSRRVMLDQVLGWTGALVAMTLVHEDEDVEDSQERAEPADRLITAERKTVAAIAEILPLIAVSLVGDIRESSAILEWASLDHRLAGTGSGIFLYGQTDEIEARIGFDPFSVAQALTVRRDSDEVTILHGGLEAGSAAEAWVDQGYTERVASFGSLFWFRQADVWDQESNELNELDFRMGGTLDFAGILDGQTVCFSSSEALLLGILEGIQPPGGQRASSLPTISVESMFDVLPPETGYAVGRVRSSDSPPGVLLTSDSPTSGNGARLDGFLVTEQSTPPNRASGEFAPPTHLLILQTEASSVLSVLREEVRERWENESSASLEDPFFAIFELNDIVIDREANAVLVEVTYDGASAESIEPALMELIGVPLD